MAVNTSGRTTAVDRAYSALLAEIQTGALPAGAVLAEVEQSARLGISRTPLREALVRLAAEGFVVQQSPRVTVVAGIDEKDIRSLFELRRGLEELAVRAAAERGDAAVFTALAESFSAAATANPGLADPAAHAGYYALISAYDAAVGDAIRNDYLASALRTVHTHLVRVRQLAKDNPERLVVSAGEHALIAGAIAEGDAALAAHATHVHLHNALISILSSIAGSSQTSTEGTP
ncbi:GntR family transcriptional regulator [Leucobacter sp. OLJS4]|uniref:GntR family transcriptional regulator n=1 Tax=unclassified Leucobacter TaxID=2621730 RepID=UPI000C17A359|nr:MULTISPECIES: GntR family transcriptional regulator [unclassified Leucobacter]PIJ21492.1 GntR family transcriptional regulator [Leucobacter sp. OLES1]PII83312.1 GntR family transcriptional regulator [Leucobacter sp. OLCALW19]PII86863.1 GntR family transcriptional regulator [Leucobacter sp. OLTLW20]PII91201.1 GntR family transcriptional regulator [Leucobacter sp. OLAS13]PII98660.1 GntR family transcriptional regulator [Leucobacter sp. OLDS2]